MFYNYFFIFSVICCFLKINCENDTTNSLLKKINIWENFDDINENLLTNHKINKHKLNSGPIVKIKQGFLRGYVSKDINNKDYYAFTGIPYAKPPTGKFRFMDPLPAENWPEKIYNATKESPMCIQRSFLKGFQISGSDDCLYLNIFTPNLKPKKLLPIMVWIHGGAFTSGGIGFDLFGPEVFMSKNVIIVTINYRLNILGFLRLNETSLNVNGNQGLKDQAEALRWIQNNILKFGGDPNQVTIFGQSAGACAAHFHLFSHEQQHRLFQKVIVQSGTSFTSWAISDELSLKVLMKIYGFDSFGIPLESIEKEFLKFLRSLNKEQIIKGLDNLSSLTELMNERPFDDLMFSPIIERNHPGAFITNYPDKLTMRKEYNQVPILIGFTKDEGFSMMQTKDLTVSIRKNNEFLVPKKIKVALKNNKDQIKNIGNEIQKFYWGNKQPSNETINETIQFVTDQMFGYDTIRTIKLQAKNQAAPVYAYHFKLKTSINLSSRLFKRFSSTDQELFNQLVVHGDDLPYIWYSKKRSENYGDKEMKLVNMMTNYWTNFAKYSNPNGLEKNLNDEDYWKPVNPRVVDDQLDYLELSNDKIKMNVNINNDRMQFWDGLYEKLNIKI